MQIKSKGFAHLFLIIGVVLVGIVGIGYFAIKNGQISLSPQKDPASQATISTPSTNDSCQPGFIKLCEGGDCECIKDDSSDQVPVGDLAGWKTYRNEKYEYQVGHPTNVVPKEFTDNDIYESFISFGDPNSEDAIRFFAIIVRKSTLEEQVEFEKWQSSHSLVSLANEAELTVNDYPAIRLDYESEEGYDYEPAVFVVVAKGKYAYVISSGPDDIDQILSTFRFIDNVSITTDKAEYIKGESVEFTINNHTNQSIYFLYGCSRPLPHLIIENKPYPLVTSITEDVPAVSEIKSGKTKLCSWDQMVWSNPKKDSPEKYREYINQEVVSPGVYILKLDYYGSEKDATTNQSPTNVTSDTFNINPI